MKSGLIAIFRSLNKGEKFTPSYFGMLSSETTAPKLLTESDLITLMDKNGIGTDATIHEHIQTVQDRNYAVKNKNEFLPTPQGVCLVEIYQKFDLKLYKPYLRAQMEKEMTMIAKGEKTKQEVLKDCIDEMYRIFLKVVSLKEKMIEVLKSKQDTLASCTEDYKTIDNTEAEYEAQSTFAAGPNTSQNYWTPDEINESEFAKCPQGK